MKRYAFLLSLACCVSLWAQIPQAHRSPESLCRAFAAQLEKAEFGKLLELSSFYDEGRVKGIDPEAVAERFRALFAACPEEMPSEYHALVRIRLLARYAQSIQTMCAVFLLPEELSDFASGKTVAANEALLRDAFSGAMAAKRLAGLELVRFDRSLEELQKNARHLANVEKYKASYGYDEQAEYAMLYRLDGKYYMGGLVLARYGDAWFIDSLKGPLANLMELQEVQGVEEYERKITYF